MSRFFTFVYVHWQTRARWTSQSHTTECLKKWRTHIHSSCRHAYKISTVHHHHRTAGNENVNDKIYTRSIYLRVYAIWNERPKLKIHHQCELSSSVRCARYSSSFDSHKNSPALLFSLSLPFSDTVAWYDPYSFFYVALYCTILHLLSYTRFRSAFQPGWNIVYVCMCSMNSREEA